MTGTPLHAEGPVPGSIPTTNPLSSSLNIVVSIPDSIEIKMVDASALADYEVWSFISSLLSSAFIGFLVAYMQGRDAHSASTAPIGYGALILLILFSVSLYMAIYKRNNLKKKGKSIKLQATNQLTQ
ncbi:hypothetical protein [Aeromonas caviae]|uniref:hypothetical protein n=1 Tax=Aeromonas caviae TaxID=648 RepID=UPI002B46AE0C|nr:hypothetical protein [Aeromonas caviae]